MEYNQITEHKFGDKLRQDVNKLINDRINSEIKEIDTLCEQQTNKSLNYCIIFIPQYKRNNI